MTMRRRCGTEEAIGCWLGGSHSMHVGHFETGLFVSFYMHSVTEHSEWAI
jgi:hypothetical protein